MSIQEFKPFKEGKVREVYDNGDSLIIVATDRISAFDHILKNKITDKGAVLTQMSKFWFDYTKDVVKNHMLSFLPPHLPRHLSAVGTYRSVALSVPCGTCSHTRAAPSPSP